jgi:hypothetical protein
MNVTLVAVPYPLTIEDHSLPIGDHVTLLDQTMIVDPAYCNHTN